MAIATGHKANFTMLQQAFDNGDVALMECQLTTTGEEVAVICAANRSVRVHSGNDRIGRNRAIPCEVRWDD